MQRLQPPAFAGGSWNHPLGTDQLGRDVLSRALHGARVSLSVALTATLIGAFAGTALGLWAGTYPRSVVDHQVTYPIDLQLSLPFILLAIAAALVLGTSLPVLIALAGLATWPAYAPVVRGVALSLREREFVLAARAHGASDVRIVLRHVFPNLCATPASRTATTSSPCRTTATARSTGPCAPTCSCRASASRARGACSTWPHGTPSRPHARATSCRSTGWCRTRAPTCPPTCATRS